MSTVIHEVDIFGENIQKSTEQVKKLRHLWTNSVVTIVGCGGGGGGAPLA